MESRHVSVWIEAAPDGRIFYAAAGQAFNPFGQAYDEALKVRTRELRPLDRMVLSTWSASSASTCAVTSRCRTITSRMASSPSRTGQTVTSSQRGRPASPSTAPGSNRCGGMVTVSPANPFSSRTRTSSSWGSRSADGRDQAPPEPSALAGPGSVPAGRAPP